MKKVSFITILVHRYCIGIYYFFTECFDEAMIIFKDIAFKFPPKEDEKLYYLIPGSRIKSKNVIPFNIGLDILTYIIILDIRCKKESDIKLLNELYGVIKMESCFLSEENIRATLDNIIEETFKTIKELKKRNNLWNIDIETLRKKATKISELIESLPSGI